MKDECFGGLRAPDDLGPTQKTFFESLLRVYFYSAVADASDYKQLGGGICTGPRGLTPIPWVPRGDVAVLLQDADAVNEVWPPGPHPGGAVVQLTLLTAVGAIAHSLDDWAIEFLEHQAGEHQWAVGAVLLMLHTMAPEVRLIFCSTGILAQPLHLWPTLCKGWWNAVRRCPYSPLAPHVGAEAWHIFRKFANVCGRSKDEADWVAERQRRTVNTPVHYALMADGRLSRGLWLSLTQAAARELCTEIVARLLTIPDLQTAQEWWENRWKTVASGSTAERASTVEWTKAHAHLFDAGARPNKKVVAEMKPDDWLNTLLMRWPRKQARQSTKHEPGFKNRALYAVDDDAFALEAFGSAEMEKRMAVSGMRVMQTPADIAAWAAQHNAVAGSGAWLSLDYSDFNSDHELSTLATLDWAFCEAWLTVGGQFDPSHQVRIDKALAAAHCAHMHWVATATGLGDASGERTIWRVFGGLFSGDRNTARDNTMLHTIYSRVMQHSIKEWGFNPPQIVNYTGDDEDSWFSDWQSSLVYMLVHSICGFELKPAKQMAGAEHEFLQRMIGREGDITQPLAAALAQFASGNWYHNTYSWYDSLPGAVSDNGWELHHRGLPLGVAQKLVALTLNQQMRVRVPENVVEAPEFALADDERRKALQRAAGQRLRLDWWPWRGSGGLGSKALWGLPSTHTAPAALVPPPPELPGNTQLPSCATDALVHVQQKRFFKAVGVRWDRYRRSLLTENYACMRKKLQADQLARWAMWNWPVRNSSADLEIDQIGRTTDARFWTQFVGRHGLGTAENRVPHSLNEVLGRMRLDPALVNAIGGLHKVLPLLEPTTIAKYTAVEVPKALPIDTAGLDSAIRSWLSNLGVSVGAKERKPLLLRFTAPREHLSEETRLLTIVYAGNCSGKTTWLQGHPSASDVDVMLVRSNTMSQLRRLGTLAGRSAPVTHVWKGIGEVLLAEGRQVLLSQMDLPELKAMLVDLGCTIRELCFDLPDRIRMMRFLDRGWGPEKCQRRLDRWHSVRDDLATRGVPIVSSNDGSWDPVDSMLATAVAG
nr:RNA-dependent RNA polymerase [Drosophila-associated totivirus 3]